MKFIKTQGDESIQEYLRYLKTIGSFSNLFSSSIKPYIQYRVAENIFCKAFEAENLARADTAYDAIIDGFGVGIKTFILSGNSKIEKVAEFNSFSAELRTLSGLNLAKRLAHYRNERILTADNIYNITDRIYHIVGRDDNQIKVFETSYDLIDFNSIEIISETKSSLKFRDAINEYNFNFSKSVLMKRFDVLSDALVIDISIITDPLEVLLNVYTDQDKYKDLEIQTTEANLGDKAIITSETNDLIPGRDYVILPLYSVKAKEALKEPIVPLKSQLNQWKAGGRVRDPGEVYVPIPIRIHKEYPDFFPDRDVQFNLRLPSGETLLSKVCQQNRKALMTNPNNALSDWLLRRVLGLKPLEILTYFRWEEVGFDSVKITKIDSSNYLIDFASIDSYELFINE